MFIAGTNTATPRNRCRQQKCWAMLRNSPQLLEFAPRSKAVLKTALPRDNGVATRHFALDETLARNQLMHPQLTNWSESVWRAHGIRSNPSVLFVLQTALNNGTRGGKWWMSSFGAEFSCHGALLEVK